MLNKKLKRVNFFNGYKVFGARQLSQCSITHIDIEHNSNNIKVSLLNEKFSVDSIDDVTKFGSSWKTLVKPFMNTIKQAVQKNGSVWAHNTKQIDKSKYYCQLAAIIGTNSETDPSGVKDDFYTLTMKNLAGCKGIRQPDLNRPGNPTPTFGFITDTEIDNFLAYVNTDFARFCLALLKAGKNAAVGEMELIPWLDFTQAWDDEKLFKHFDVNKDTQDYIRKFLPDYYGIRK